MTRLAWFGVALSAFYLLCLLVFICTFWAKFSGLEPNAWGDFLAGTLGPLGIFWLVLGYFQQGTELRHSVEALRLQAEELQNSVEQQKAMVGITEKQLTLDIEVRREQKVKAIADELPLFRCSGPGIGGTSPKSTTKFSFRLENIGPDATSCSYSLSNQEIVNSSGKFSSVLRNENVKIDFYIPNHLSRDWSAELTFESKNIRGQIRTQVFKIGNFAPTEVSCDPRNQ